MLIKKRYGLAFIIKTLPVGLLSFGNTPFTKMVPQLCLVLYLLASGVYGAYLVKSIYIDLKTNSMQRLFERIFFYWPNVRDSSWLIVKYAFFSICVGIVKLQDKQGFRKSFGSWFVKVSVYPRICLNGSRKPK